MAYTKSIINNASYTSGGYFTGQINPTYTYPNVTLTYETGLTAPPTAEVADVITRMEGELLAAGYTQEQVNAMTKAFAEIAVRMKDLTEAMTLLGDAAAITGGKMLGPITDNLKEWRKDTKFGCWRNTRRRDAVSYDTDKPVSWVCESDPSLNKHLIVGW